MKPLRFSSRKRWRQWLRRNHEARIEALISIYKKPPRNARFSADDAVEEALCFGWIDGWFKPIDSERWVVRFTPRRKGSNWSDYNIARAWKLLGTGRMTSHGTARLPRDVVRVWKRYRPIPSVIDPRKGEIRFSGRTNFISKVKRPALAP